MNDFSRVLSSNGPRGWNKLCCFIVQNPRVKHYLSLPVILKVACEIYAALKFDKLLAATKIVIAIVKPFVSGKYSIMRMAPGEFFSLR